MAQEPDVKREDALTDQGSRVIGLKLPGLKRWRMRSGLTQQQLADRVGARLQYISRVEQGRGCNKTVAQKIAEVLDVSLQELGAGSEESGTRYLHKAYLKLLLESVVGSGYLALDETELESYSEQLSVEELVEVISRRRKELEFVQEVLASKDELLLQMRLFLEELVKERPDEDIRILAARRAHEHSEEERQSLTQAMRELL